MDFFFVGALDLCKQIKFIASNETFGGFRVARYTNFSQQLLSSFANSKRNKSFFFYILSDGIKLASLSRIAAVTHLGGCFCCIFSVLFSFVACSRMTI